MYTYDFVHAKTNKNSSIKNFLSNSALLSENFALSMFSSVSVISASERCTEGRQPSRLCVGWLQTAVSARSAEGRSQSALVPGVLVKLKSCCIVSKATCGVG